MVWRIWSRIVGNRARPFGLPLLCRAASKFIYTEAQFILSRPSRASTLVPVFDCSSFCYFSEFDPTTSSGVSAPLSRRPTGGGEEPKRERGSTAEQPNVLSRSATVKPNRQLRLEHPQWRNLLV